ncbi:MAG: helix-turn-helix transcriptional regulator [Lentisphaeria bacterium]|nr:helix-turn-helix transcriptional regulator [Lentisphaeria bacterium]
METVLVSRAVEQHDLDSVPNRTRLEFTHADTRLVLNLDLFNFGCDLREEERHYRHLSPPFCRLFHFAGAVSPGAEIIIGGAVHRLDTAGIYLLNAEHSFDVRYFAGSKLCYAHLRLADHTRSSVFHDAPGLLRIEQPVISAYLEHAWETGMPLAIQSAAAAAMSEFVAPHLERLRERSELFSRFAPVLAAIDRTPPARLRVSELADVMQMTPFALSKSFRRKIGMPLKEYLNTIYLDRARELLTCSGGTVEDVAVLLGHSDVHYFYHAFRRLTGLSPGEYRAERMNFGTKTDECPEIARI